MGQISIPIYEQVASGKGWRLSRAILRPFAYAHDVWTGEAKVSLTRWWLTIGWLNKRKDDCLRDGYM